MSDWTSVGGLVGGIGLFLLGMNLMTDGLKLAAGSALANILARSTRTRVRGLASGVLVTVLVQSSIAVTVATIGFVNAGLLTLGQSLWVLFGSNVGTTMTGWLVALAGLKFKVELFALPLIGIGMALRISGERARRGALGLALNETPPTDKRPAAQYRVAESTVILYGQEYRAVVVHSSAHDKRRQKRIEREIQKSETTLLKLLEQESKREYYCRADAEQAADRLRESGTELHYLEILPNEKVRYVRGHPTKNQPRKVASVRYVLEAKVYPNIEQLERKRREAGCFVLLSNVPLQGNAAQTGADLLRAYKEQYGIERNFSFLKDPLIVNDTFLKKPERIEVLGTILLMALLVWNLIENVLRQHVCIQPDRRSSAPP